MRANITGRFANIAHVLVVRCVEMYRVHVSDRHTLLEDITIPVTVAIFATENKGYRRIKEF